MAGPGSRMSVYSNHSNVPRPAQPSAQLSTTTLLNALHSVWTTSQPYALESSTSLVVNTWVTSMMVGPDGRQGGTVDSELGRRAWEHARRRAEDGCVVLGSLHESTPSLLVPFLTSLPIAVPTTLYTALNAIRPFLYSVTPRNPSTAQHNGLAAVLNLNLEGELTGASLSLSSSGINVARGLTDVPAEIGHRAFDVFYYLLSSASPAEKEFLNLQEPKAYALLKKTDTYTPPLYLPTADDAAAADDFRASLKDIGIKGAALRNMLSVVAAILKLGETMGFLVDEDVLENVCEEVADLLDLDTDVLTKKCDTMERQTLMSAIYEALVDWVIARANEAIRMELRNGGLVNSSSGSDTENSGGILTPPPGEDGADSVNLTILDLPSATLGKAMALRTVFDDSTGINLEMKEDGVPSYHVGSSIVREMTDAVNDNAAELELPDSVATREREEVLDRRETLLEKVGVETEADSFLRRLLYPVEGEGIQLGKAGRFSLMNLLGSSRVWFQLALHPTDESPASLANHSPNSFPWSAGSVSSQIRSWRLPEWANHRNKKLDYTADFDINEFQERYARLGCQLGRDGVESWIMERGWSNGEVVIGHERIWIREAPWWEAESMLDLKPMDPSMDAAGPFGGQYQVSTPMVEDGFYQQPYHDNPSNPFLSRNQSFASRSQLGAKSIAPSKAPTMQGRPGDYGLGTKGDNKYGDVTYYGEIEDGDAKVITEVPITFSRKAWIWAVWALTFYIPSPALRYIGRMKRPDVRQAWREKFALMIIIFIINATVVFYIVAFGKLLCPNMDKAWSAKEVGYHAASNDYYVSFRGHVYDLTKFHKTQHSDSATQTTTTNMEPFGGTDVSEYIVPPLSVACYGLVGADYTLQLTANDSSAQEYPQAMHLSGPNAVDTTSALNSTNWYADTFLPKMKEFYKGDLVVKKNKVKSDGQDNNHYWFTLGQKIYDMTDYFHTLDLMNDLATYKFFPDEFSAIVQSNPGLDIKQEFDKKITNATEHSAITQCLDNMFYSGKLDFRDSPRCQVNNYILLVFTIILCTVIVVKFLAALQFGSKPRPAPQDKFVICQVPAYTEGEDHLRKGLDSLTSLAYDNKRKLICVICDGMIVGGGNDRPTPKIVLDILGVDPKIDPPALPFKSIGAGAEQLNYGKVYSGLYEFEGNVVPYIVVVKCGKESEQVKAKPGNRGKRDSQILLMSFLNRVHHRSPMSPLELEMFHQINNVIGVDPELYEYLLMVDADTLVKEDALTRLVAACTNDSKIAGICGETSLENEEQSWTTMIQVYEYYISHHLSKAFESLFGSVTCLPGCFTMYRLRTADKGKPLIIADAVIEEYSDCNVDTLHKKNLLSLGEDRWLTTLMTKNFPQMSFKFIPDAYAQTAAPETWSILLSQRRRWINSTIHNLAELMLIKDMCGFCCFSMRFVVFIDLFGTVILPATVVYLVYLIVTASTGGQFPLISIIMLAGVYGLQAVIFIAKRQWQHIGWMICYLAAYPLYSFVLPVYSFWKQDDFSWGNTRVVIGETGAKQVIAVDAEEFDPRSIPLQRWDDYAYQNQLPGRRGMVAQEKEMGFSPFQDNGGYEMDEIRSVYSSVHPASTILTGLPNNNMPYRPPTQSPGPYNAYNRMSSYSRFTDAMPGANENSRLMSMGNMSDTSPGLPRNHSGQYLSQPDLLSPKLSPPPSAGFPPRSRSPLSQTASRPASTFGLPGFQTQGVTDSQIVDAVRDCLREVDLDTVTKKQLKVLTEQRLQMQLDPQKRAFLDQQIDFELANM
ncbi:chitin synthase [Aureobasidium sp. EXF-10728]|nr:chitin synthase [Aureobasidium sp. EXF-10728]